MLNTLYMTLTASPTGAVDIACSEPRLVLPLRGAVPDKPGSGFAKASVHTMAWDMLAFAAHTAALQGGNVAANRVNPVLLIGLAQALLDPEQLGHAVTAEVRDMARLALGLPAVESHLKPVAVTDWSNDMDESESVDLPEAHAASVDRITQAEKNRYGAKSAADHKAAEQEFLSAVASHKEIFGTPFKRNGVWQ